MNGHRLPYRDVEYVSERRDFGLRLSGTALEFDAITQLASVSLDCPIALISIAGQDGPWRRANVDLEGFVVPRELTFCTHTIAQAAPLIVPDARRDARFRNTPTVAGDPKIVFYAGVPLYAGAPHPLGTLCVIDQKPRGFKDTEVEHLRCLARITEGLMLAFKKQRDIEDKSERLARATFLLEHVKQLTGVGGWELRLNPLELTWTDETKRIHEVPLDYAPQLDTAIDFYAPEVRAVVRAAVETAMKDGAPWDLQLPLITAKGRRIFVRAVGSPIYENGEMTSLIGAFQDISDQRRTEDRIRASERVAREKSESLLAILDNMDEGVSVFDKDGRLTTWNDKYLQVFGKPAHEVARGVSFRAILEHEQRRGEFEGDVDQHIRTLKERLLREETVSYQFRTKAGKIINSAHTSLPAGGWVGTHKDVTEQVRAAEWYEYASLHDTLTGLPNRLAFDVRMEGLRETTEDNQSVALLLIDLDNFKEVNDTAGHQAGDVLLKEAARRLQACVRRDDLVARLGGDEFACVIVCGQADIERVAERTALRITESLMQPFQTPGYTATIGASVGVSVFPTQGLVVDEALHHADDALYTVKGRGRGSYHFHNNNNALTRNTASECPPLRSSVCGMHP